MNRSLRTILVVGIAVGLASAATYLVYRAIQNRPMREVEVAHAFAVVAAHPLALGSRITAEDVKVVPWPASSLVPGGFIAIDQVVDKGVIAPVAENEPLNTNNLASKEAGVGLPPTIPPGMRAISVKVNEVIGVAGFVVPGTRVDVMVILHTGTTSVARVVVGNVQVLTAGTRYDQESAREGKALPSSVVTLMVSPADAELVGLAASEGQIMLTLRNPLDTAVTPTTGTSSSRLAGDQSAAKPASAPGAAPARRAPPPPPPPTEPAPKKPVPVIKAGVIKEIIK
jgi:pilus assembly protein CpaB